MFEFLGNLLIFVFILLNGCIKFIVAVDEVLELFSFSLIFCSLSKLFKFSISFTNSFMLTLIPLSLLEIFSRILPKFSDILSNLTRASGIIFFICWEYPLACSIWFLHSLASLGAGILSLAVTLSTSRIHSLWSIFDSIICLSGKALKNKKYFVPGYSSRALLSLISSGSSSEISMLSSPISLSLSPSSSTCGSSSCALRNSTSEDILSLLIYFIESWSLKSKFLIFKSPVDQIQ